MSSSPMVQDLGFLFPKQGYDWNIWDMQLYNERIYIGYGNYKNEGPRSNAGPITIVYLDTKLNKIVPHFVTSEEQIDNFKILDNKLYAPGTDPMDSWDYGNFYRMVDDQWVRVRNVPDAMHDFDMELLNGRLFIATGTSGNGIPTVYVSEDMGNTWKPVTVQNGSPYLTKLLRTYTLFNFKGKIYAATLMYNMSNVGDYNRILVTDGITATTVRVAENTMFPGAPKGIMYRMMRPTVALGCMIYITGIFELSYEWKPEGLYYAPAVNQARRVKLPLDGVLPMDILNRGNTVYVLAYIKITETLYTNIVYKTSNLIDWTEVLRFDNDTFARSFEELNGAFYFGMGCYSNKIASSTGKIIKAVI